ncbi:OLC1v1017592C1 [Oldenlandia corymbosa var. corymbosa]|uniref:OLC1v1017592C1 n=1 Tax=Oldenlandia corymbosa var. corymbosa TaxID=529605 RepID=A0AAV1E9U3_OLDCO|nr:OLC1v1017592C1 [Oldenlandia corymbosa var. corymbosa]
MAAHLILSLSRPLHSGISAISPTMSNLLSTDDLLKTYRKTPFNSQCEHDYYPGSRSSSSCCSTCSSSMKKGDGHAIFTAECWHSFHFNCITSYLKGGQGNHQVCAVCNVKGTEISLQSGFNDDDIPESKLSFPEDELSTMKLKTYTEFPAVSQSSAPDNFAVLINLQVSGQLFEPSFRVPVDIVTVLDVSGNMKGSKIALLKQAMEFLIQNLGPNDRLSVVAFSDAAWCLFLLCWMSESGKQQALQALNLLEVVGSTNIADGLIMGTKVLEDRKYKNPVASILLLSDGQDNHMFKQLHYRQNHRPDYRRLLPELQVNIQCADPWVSLSSIKAGSFANQVTADGKKGSIDVGDLYADEERDFLVTVKVPTEISRDETALLKVKCVYSDLLTMEMMIVRSEEVRIRRHEKAGHQDVSVEVDRQQRRLEAVEAMALALAATEKGDLSGATSFLEECRKKLLESVSAKSHDILCLALEAELKGMQEKLANRIVYRRYGRARICKGMRSFRMQRASGAGLSEAERAYQTPEMAKMVKKSKAA